MAGLQAGASVTSETRSAVVVRRSLSNIGMADPAGEGAVIVDPSSRLANALESASDETGDSLRVPPSGSTAPTCRCVPQPLAR